MKPNLKIKNLKGRIDNSLSGALRTALVGLLVLVQIIILIILPLVLNQYTIYFYLIMELVSFIFILTVTNQNRSSSYKIAWFCIVLIFPVSGYIMFALWGKTGKRNKLQQRILKRMEEVKHYLVQDDDLLDAFCIEHPVTSRMSKYMTAEGAPLYRCSDAKYYRMGEDAFEDMFEDIANAKRFVLIDFFIVAEGALWDQLHGILLERIHDGVEVKFLYDDFGAALRTGKDFARNLIEEGFEVQVFNPIHRYMDQLFMNYRSHQKIVVIDGSIGYTGGFNLADEYANIIQRFGVWKDTGIRIKGDAVWGLTVTFMQMWHVCSGMEPEVNKYRAEEVEVDHEIYCHIISDGPASNPKNFIESVYKQMINYSSRTICIMTPYLVLEDYMRQSLIEAACRGVDVRIVTPSIPDKKNIKYITEYNYGLLLQNGVRIYEYTPGFIHAKVILSEYCAIVGTINMDYRSFYLHYENGVWIYDHDTVEEIKNDFEDTFAESREITYEEWLERPWGRKIIQNILNVFSTLV